MFELEDLDIELDTELDIEEKKNSTSAGGEVKSPGRKLRGSRPGEEIK